MTVKVPKKFIITQNDVWIGAVSTIIGLIVFTLNWQFWDLWNEPIPGYQVLLFPGNVSLVYFWHPLFTEEVNLLPKLLMILTGQFVISTCVFVVLRCLVAMSRRLLYSFRAS